MVVGGEGGTSAPVVGEWVVSEEPTWWWLVVREVPSLVVIGW